MARSRRGSFGLQPRVSPNVSGQIIALAREYVAKRDSLIMDAWKSGGIFEGKKASDDMVLGYWNERMKGMDESDPEYESAKNNVMQLQYGIEQSKADLSYVQGKLSDSGYAQFFLNWAKKVPKNSEFWRSLQKDAAKLMQTAKERARVDGEKARVESFNKFSDTISGGSIAVANSLRDAIYQLADDTKLDVEADGDRLLSLLSEDFKGNPIKYRKLAEALKKNVPGFSGIFTRGFVAKQADASEEGYGKIAARAKRDGYVTAYAAAVDAQSKTASWGQSMNVWPVAKQYDQAYRMMASVMGDAHASEDDKQSASLAFAAMAKKLSMTPGIDIASKTMLEADAARASGEDGGDSPSFGAAILNGGMEITSDLAVSVKRVRELQAQKAANPDQFTYAPTKADGTFDPSGRGPISIIAVSEVPADSALVTIPGRNGKMIMVHIPAHEILTATDPFNPSAKPEQTGKVATYYVGDRVMTIYSYKDDAGKTKWTGVNPVNTDGGATSRVDEQGNLIISPPPPDVRAIFAQAAQIDKMYGTNIAAKVEAAIRTRGKASVTSLETAIVATTAEGRQISGHVGSNTVTYEGGKFTVKKVTSQYNPTTGAKEEVSSEVYDQPTYSTSDVKRVAIDPSLRTETHMGVSFDTSIAASIALTRETNTSMQVSALAQDPVFQRAFLTQTMEAVGTSNPMDRRVTAAWDGIMARGSDTDRQLSSVQSGKEMRDRTDLQLPGTNRGADPTKTNVSINFNGRTLQLPALPSYMQVTQEQELKTKMPSYMQALTDLERKGQLPVGGGILTPSTSVKTRPTEGPPVTTYSVKPVTVGPMTVAPPVTVMPGQHAASSVRPVAPVIDQKKSRPIGRGR